MDRMGFEREPCQTITMFAFGGEQYCQTHRVMGPCPYGLTDNGLIKAAS